MILSLADSCNGFTTHLVENEENHVASEFLKNNYKLFLRVAYASGIKDKAEDLIHDVFASILEAENNLKGFDAEYGIKKGTSDKLIDVREYVAGMITKYAKNKTYNSEYVETYQKHDKATNEIKYEVIIKAATSDESTTSDDDEEDSFQARYRNACTSDSIDDVVRDDSLPEEIEFFLDICDNNEIDGIKLLKNLGEMLDAIGSSSVAARRYFGTFKKLGECLKYNDDAAEAFRDIISCCYNNRGAYDLAVQAY